VHFIGSKLVIIVNVMTISSNFILKYQQAAYLQRATFYSRLALSGFNWHQSAGICGAEIFIAAEI